MPKKQRSGQVLKEVVGKHLSDSTLVRYHDGTLDGETLRVLIALHLELCAMCRDRLVAVPFIHLSQEELIEYHTAQVRNPRTLTRVRTHLEEKHCPLCLRWLDDLQRAEDEAVGWLATHQPKPVSAKKALLEAVRQRLAAARQRLEDFLPTPVPYGLVPVPATRHDTEPATPAGVYGKKLAWLIEKTTDGGFTVTFGREDEEHAGVLVEFVCMTQEAQEILLRGFSVLPASEDAYESGVQVPREDTEHLSEPLLVQVYPIEPATLTADDIAALDWSMRHAADTVSRDAWQAFCGRVREDRSVLPAVRQWCARPTS